MLDPVQILISVGGVSLVLGLVWLATRREPPVVLGGEVGARAWIRRELLGFQVGELAVDVGDRRALAVSADGSEVALVYVMGRRLTSWRLPLGKLGQVELRQGGEGEIVIEVPTGDFTRRRFSLTIRGSQEDARLLLGARLNARRAQA
jgi:hypothetical protein